jgi:hypothetical protein
LQLPGPPDELRRALGALGSGDGAAALAAASADAPASCIAERITRALADWTQLIGAPDASTRLLNEFPTGRVERLIVVARGASLF